MPFWDKVSDIIAWSSSHFAADESRVPRIRLPHAASVWQGSLPKHRTKLLVCHDMMGGYSEQDAHPDGNPSLASIFTIHHWASVSEFIYFSHHRLSIPPPQWTNLAHCNGCPIYGTFIVEHKEGRNELLNFIYGNQRPIPIGSPSFDACDSMVEIAAHFKLDGWLINMESPALISAACAMNLSQNFSEKESNIQQGVLISRDLTTILKRMRSRMLEVCGTHTKVLWYDGLTQSGVVACQNRLCEGNYCSC